MIVTRYSWPADADTHIGPILRKPDGANMRLAGSMDRRRSAIALSEPEDAHLTGMTRSLDRRLLALNLKPMAKVAHAASAAILKVA